MADVWSRFDAGDGMPNLDPAGTSPPGDPKIEVGLTEPEATPEANAQEIDRLSRLSSVDYAQERKPAAQALGIGVGALDKAVAAQQAKRRREASAAERTRQPPAPGETRWPFGFVMQEDGLHADTGSEAGLRWLSAPIQVLGEGRNAAGESWAKWLSWHDGDGRQHTWAMPSRLLTSSHGELEGELADRGLRIDVDSGARALLRQALAGVQSGNRVTLVPQPGWHAPAGGDPAFVLLNGETIGTAREALVLKTAVERAEQRMGVAGTLDTWKMEVAGPAAGNPIAAFMISAAFAGPLLDVMGETSGGFHFFGRSKTGKTLALRMAISVWGMPKESGLLRNWRATANAMELVAEECSDGLLPLDEIHQGDPREVVAAIYQLANEGGKQRLTRQSQGQRRRAWRSIVLSTGETDVAGMAAKAGQQMPAGADVRVPSVPIDGGSMWPELHGLASANALSTHLQAAIQANYGTPIRAFLQRLAEARKGSRTEIEATADEVRECIMKRLPADADPQVRDVARRCVLVGLAGELATRWGILPWDEGEATAAASDVLGRWTQRRGGSGSAEESQHIRAVRSFLLEHGASRFVALTMNDAGSWMERFPERVVVHRAGWRRSRIQDDNHGSDEFLIPPDVWSEICAKAGIDPVETAKTLVAAGLLAPGDGKNLTRQQRVPGVGKARFYIVRPAIFTGREVQSDEAGRDEGAREEAA